MPAEPIIDLEGLVYAADLEEIETLPPTHVALDQIIAQAVSPDMLEDEPLAAELLTRFRERLILSLQHVDQALALVHRSRPPADSD